MAPFLRILKKDILNIPGWQTKRHLIVLESDDWGSIRMPSNDVFNSLTKSGINLYLDEGARFNKYDSIATYDDLASLFDTLCSVRDSMGREAVFTPVSVVANPDFAKIRESNYTKYFFEPFTITLQKYQGCENSFVMWREGIEKRLFVPQFHGREHLNVATWMRALESGNKEVRLAFDNQMWGISTANIPNIGVEFQAAFDLVEFADLKYHKEVIVTGLSLFENLFGYRATYFVPPNGPFNTGLESQCANEGINYLCVSRIQNEPLGHGKTKKLFHWLGQKGQSGLTYITRNCLFEPGELGRDWVDSCLKDISSAFKWHKPAIISSHRVNYTGALEISNRDNGLRNLKLLLKGIIKTWPDAEFLTSAELGRIISYD